VWVLRVSLRPRLAAIVIAGLLLATGSVCLGQSVIVRNRDSLRSSYSLHYEIWTNASASVGREYAKHMDLVYSQYTRRFQSFRIRNAGRMPLYLFRTRQQFLDFLSKMGMDGSASSGVFFVMQDKKGLATWVEGKSAASTLSTLQHEGFHQFAYSYIGTNLPVWVNEGLAEYFGDGILVRNQLVVGLATDRRVETVKAAIHDGSIIDFNELFEMRGRKWHLNMLAGGDKGRLQYDQSWSIVSFLIHGKNGKYRRALEVYLKALGEGRSSRRAFATAFGSTDTVSFSEQWRSYALAMEPDPVNTTMVRMSFLGEGLVFLRDQGQAMPDSLTGLRKALTTIDFSTYRRQHGLTIKRSATDETSYQYTDVRGNTRSFTLLAPARSGFPSRIAAPGIKPEPTLNWLFDDDGKLIHEIQFR